MTEGLICGTGIGMAISANKVQGAYAGVCHDSTERPVLSNDANIMCIGALVAGKALALLLVKQWGDLAFAQSPSGGKIKKIKEAGQREYAAPAHNCG